jgi:hypothetical protein
MTAAAALASVRHVRQDHARRAALFERAAAPKVRFDRARRPRIDSVSHIVPLHIGEAALCTEVSQRLLNEFGMDATPISDPTVPQSWMAGPGPIAIRISDAGRRIWPDGHSPIVMAGLVPAIYPPPLKRRWPGPARP